MIARAFITAVVVATAAFGQTRAPDSAPMARPGWRLLGGVWVQPSGEFYFSQLVTASIVNRRLSIAITPDEFWQPKLINGRRVIAEGMPSRSLWWIMLGQTTQIVPADRRGAMLVLLPAFDPAADKSTPLRVTGLSIAPGGVLLRGAGVAEGRFVQVEFKAARDGSAPRLTVITAAGRGYDFTGDDLLDLLQKDAPIARKFLSPLLLQLSGRDLLQPRPADVYRAFIEIEPTEQERLQFAQHLEQLNADDPATRDAAMEALRRIGPSMVLVALRTSPAGLSNEQINQVRMLIDDNTLGELDMSRLRADAEWLHSLETFPDRRVRDLARELLTELTD